MPRQAWTPERKAQRQRKREEKRREGKKKEGRRRVSDIHVHTIRLDDKSWHRFIQLRKDLGLQQSSTFKYLIEIGEQPLRTALREIGKGHFRRTEAKERKELEP
jgi:hypothetical protein